MFTWGPKYVFAISMSALLLALVYGVVTGGDPIGAATMGYKGGVGDHLGYAILIGVAVAAQVLTWVLVATRDGDAEAMAVRAGSPTVPPVNPPADPSFWGPLSAFGVAAIVIGLSISRVYFYLGLAVLFVAGLMWLVQAWSDRATGDPEANRIIRTRVAGPFEVPMLSLLGFAVMALAMSRVFLAASVNGAVIAGTIVTLIIFGGAVILANVEVKPSILRGLLALGAVAVLAGGIAAAAIGERDFHHGEEHSDEEHSDEEHSDEEGLKSGVGEGE